MTYLHLQPLSHPRLHTHSDNTCKLSPIKRLISTTEWCAVSGSRDSGSRVNTCISAGNAIRHERAGRLYVAHQYQEFGRENYNMKPSMESKHMQHLPLKSFEPMTASCLLVSLTVRDTDDCDADLHHACRRWYVALECVGAWLWVARELALSADARARL